jgi:flavin reductase (DIM6/NTAB) family NADH-FMN oxidoreductase RutF
MKKEMGPMMGLYPMLVILVGALVDGKPNYATIAHVGIIDFTHLSVSMGKSHYTNAGIKANRTFSVNLPSQAMVKETDHCGLVSGKKEDKSGIFKTFFGSLETAPMIEECPLNMECKLIQTIDMERHDVFIGEIVQTYFDENCLDSGKPDFEKIAPVLFSPAAHYFRLGERFASAWSVGKELKKN